MDFAAFGNLGDMALLAALASTRFAVAFLLLPVLAQETVPATVRGALFWALASSRWRCNRCWT